MKSSNYQLLFKGITQEYIVQYIPNYIFFINYTAMIQFSALGTPSYRRGWWRGLIGTSYRSDMFDRAVPISVGFTSLRLVIIFKTFHHLLSQSEVIAKPGMARSGTFPRPSR